MTLSMACAGWLRRQLSCCHAEAIPTPCRVRDNLAVVSAGILAVPGDGPASGDPHRVITIACDATPHGMTGIPTTHSAPHAHKSRPGCSAPVRPISSCLLGARYSASGKSVCGSPDKKQDKTEG